MENNRIDTLLTFLKEDPEDAFIRFALAKEYEKLGTLKKALDTYIELKNIDPDYMGLYYHLGGLYEKLNEPANALTIYDEGITLAKRIADFHSLSELHNAKTNLEIST